MYKKLVGILVMMLLITTALPAVGITNIKIVDENPLPLQNGAIDQEQTTHCGTGMQLRPPLTMAQSFKPSIENLTSVRLCLFKGGTPPDGVEITVSIRDALNGTDLTSKTINTDEVEIKKSATWVNFDFDDIKVTPEETYYIVCIGSDGSDQNCYCWLFDIGDKYPRGEGWWYNETSATWITLWELFEFDPQWEEPDLCFKTYFRDSEICCDGEINLVDMDPGDERTEYFDIYNCGADGSELSWEVVEWPEWGSGWTFTPASGTGLTPTAGPATIQVDFVIPSKPDDTFTGTIKVGNINDPYDYCEIPVSVTTPRIRTLKNTLLLRLFDHFPNAFPILRQLLGLK